MFHVKPPVVGWLRGVERVGLRLDRKNFWRIVEGVVTAEVGATRAEEIRAGIRESWAVGLGLIPLGLAFGVLMTQSGFAWWWTPIFSLMIFAGSMEFLAIGLVTAGVGPVSAALTTFLVNFRHVFYGLTFPRSQIKSKLGRVYSTYGLIDEAYAIVSARPPGKISGTRLLTIQILCQSLWVIPGIVGALLGENFLQGLRGAEFALTALFIVLAWESFRTNPDWSLPLMAIALSVLSAWVLPKQMMVAGLTLYVGFLLLRYWMPRVDRAFEWRGKKHGARGALGETVVEYPDADEDERK